MTLPSIELLIRLSGPPLGILMALLRGAIIVFPISIAEFPYGPADRNVPDW